jgi:galactose mutarotase-like enzyme
MVTIAVESRQYTTYVLAQPDGQSVLEIVPERGGIVTSWQVQEQEIFYLDRDRFTDPSLSVRGGNPILFPICGNLLDNAYTHNNQQYSLKQHGFGRDLPWKVVSQDPDSGSLSLSLESTDETRLVYPFEFLFTLTYTLQYNKLTVHQKITNGSSEALPFSVGFHPYFFVADKSRLEVEIPGTTFDNNRTKAIETFGGQFDFESEEIDAAFRPLSGHVAKVRDRQRRLQLTLKFSPEFSTLVFWTVKGKEFYCLEPWTGPRNAMNTGENLLHVPAGDSLETQFSLTVDFF